MMKSSLVNCLSAFLLTIVVWLPHVFADEFASPSSSAADLSVKYTLGESVTLTWTTSLQELSLYVAHWGGNDIGALLTDATNPNVYVWTVGQNDNIDNTLLSSNSDFVLLLRDPSGQTTTGNDFVNGELQSRGFVIQANTSSSSTSSSASLSTTSSSSVTKSLVTSTASAGTTPSASSISAASTTPSSSSTIPSSTPATSYSPLTSASSSPNPTPATGLPTSTITGIGVGAAVGAVALMGLSALAAILILRSCRPKTPIVYEDSFNNAPEKVVLPYTYGSHPEKIRYEVPRTQGVGEMWAGQSSRASSRTGLRELP